MASIANTRMTFGAVLATVQSTADTITSTLDAANSAVGMLNKTVTDAAQRQKVRSVLDMAIFSKTLHQEKAKELADSRVELLKYMEQSSEHRSNYEKAFEELEALMKA